MIAPTAAVEELRKTSSVRVIDVVQTRLEALGKRPKPLSKADIEEYVTLAIMAEKEAQALYKFKDECQDVLVAALPTDERFTLPDGTTYYVRDNFVDPKTKQPRNVGWKICGVRLKELEWKEPKEGVR